MSKLSILPEIGVKVEILAYFYDLKLAFLENTGLSYIIPKKEGLSYISRAEKRGSMEFTLPVHLLYGSTPPGRSPDRMTTLLRKEAEG